MRGVKKGEYKGRYRGKSLYKGANGQRIWVCGDLITTADGRAFIFPVDYPLRLSSMREEFGVYSAIPILIEVDPESVGMCLDVTDKRGKRIFEGDIVKHEDYYTGDVKYGIVKWDMDVLAFIVEDPYNKEDDFWYDEMGQNFIWEDLEIIGNIYDNPELLRGSNEQ